jgi:hypothetical protein
MSKVAWLCGYGQDITAHYILIGFLWWRNRGRGSLAMAHSLVSPVLCLQGARLRTAESPVREEQYLGTTLPHH